MTAEREKLATANLPVVTREIGGVRYSVSRLGWWGMMDALHRLEALLGPSLESIVSADPAAIRDMLEADAGGVARAVALLVRRLTDSDGRALLEILGRQTMIEPDGRRVFLTADVMDSWFGQRPEDALLWIAFCLEVQFRDFFERPMRELGAYLGAHAPTTTTTVSLSQST